MDKKDSLANVIFRLQEEEKSSSVDNTHSIKSIFDIWSQQNTIVKAVKDGNSTFYNQFLELLDKYESSLVRAGHYPQDIGDLEECLGVGMTFINLGRVNPIYTGVGGVISGGVISAALFHTKEQEQINRRSFLFKVGAPVTALSTYLGTTFGLTFYKVYQKRIKEAGDNAHMLDNIYSNRVRG